jgi:hypothetical protein
VVNTQFQTYKKSHDSAEAPVTSHLSIPQQVKRSDHSTTPINTSEGSKSIVITQAQVVNFSLAKLIESIITAIKDDDIYD